MLRKFMKHLKNGAGKKVFFSLYMGLVVLVATGWTFDPQKEEDGSLPGTSGEQSMTLRVMAENQVLFEPGIRETSEEARMECQILDESCRRTVKVRQRRVRYQGVLERIVEAEAGDQDLKGRILVANVVLNRVRSKEFPDSIREVVFERRQFSPISNGSYYSVHVSSLTKRAVRKALDGTDYSHGALYFMDRRISSSSNIAWFDSDLKRLFSYGCHEFFM